ncbi:hypothetical protein NQZ68_007781 [Dissostichus eleginoides]|nr:hypothetical protein NQZ68_007781 [Dissostichus eleginoides]
MDYVLPQPGSHSMGGWNGCPASADSLPRPLVERTPRAPSVLKAGSLRMQRVLPTPAPYAQPITAGEKWRPSLQAVQPEWKG